MMIASDLLEMVRDAIASVPETGIEPLMVFDKVAEAGTRDFGSVVESLQWPSNLLRYVGVDTPQYHVHRFELVMLQLSNLDSLGSVARLLNGFVTPGVRWIYHEIHPDLNPIQDYSATIQARGDGVELVIFRFAFSEKGFA